MPLLVTILLRTPEIIGRPGQKPSSNMPTVVICSLSYAEVPVVRIHK